jgi:hypothetical protein
MAKSRIIKELANNEVPLEVAINRLLIIASDTDNEKLAQWAEKELNGYSNEDNIPSYRIVKVEDTIFKYSGINGIVQFKNVTLPLIELLEGEDIGGFNINILDGIKTVEKIVSNNTNDNGRDMTALAPMIYNKTGTQCYSIIQKVPENAFENVLNILKTMLLRVLIELDKSYGCLDGLDINIDNKTSEEIAKINMTVNNYIFADNSVHVGDKNKIKNTDIFKGRKSL